eukprot:1105115-Amphidinium_carterae.1
MTDDRGTIGIVCITLDFLLGIWHCPLVIYYGWVHFYACSSTSTWPCTTVIINTPSGRNAYVRLMSALRNLLSELKSTNIRHIHVFGVPFSGPVTCWARWATKAVVMVDRITQKIIMLFQQSPYALPWHAQVVQGGMQGVHACSNGAARNVVAGTRGGVATQWHPFRIIGTGETPGTAHVIRNGHDLVSMEERHRRSDRSHSATPTNLEGVRYAQEFIEDDRMHIGLRLMMLRDSLHELAEHYEELGGEVAVQYATHRDVSPAADSKTEEEAEPSLLHVCQDCWRKHGLLPMSEDGSDGGYSRPSYTTSREVEWSAGSTSPGSWHMADLNTPSHQSEQSCLDSNRTLRMQSTCSSRSSLCEEDFVRFGPATQGGSSWSNPLQLIPLFREHYDEEQRAQICELAMNDQGHEGARPPMEGNLALLQQALYETAIPRHVL